MFTLVIIKLLYSSSLQENKSTTKTNFTLTDFCLPKKQNNFLIASTGNMFKTQNKQLAKPIYFNNSYLTSEEKLRKKIDSVNQILLNETSKLDFRNRPVLNMNTRNLSFSSRDFLNNSTMKNNKQINPFRSGSCVYYNDDKCRSYGNKYSNSNKRVDALMNNLTAYSQKRTTSNMSTLISLKKLVML